VLIAAGSTAVLGALLVTAVANSPGWPRVQQSFFDPAVATQALTAVLRGLWLNVRTLVFCAVGALALGLAIALARTLRPAVFFPLRAAATSYTHVFRAGIESVHPAQRAAARSLGLSHAQTMRHVVLPQAVRRVAPPLLNDLVALQKDVGLISLAGPVDAIRAAQIETATSYNFTPYVVAGVLFILMAIPLVAVTDWVTLRAARRQTWAGAA